ncbi:hypothetical protein O6H91_11G016400 [Diphasiastrum complanatum]|uniref:Uncharacterized protein n=1 Tax=Diphasiastrum complanatum TaxID=34168 RepID=A0ACC2C6N6_DIPCM|nr:hypothetical protein O6H91_11G016400 [Diphasiastrum complanatum]
MSENHGPKLEDLLGGTLTDGHYNYCNPQEINFSDTSLYDRCSIPPFTETSRANPRSSLTESTLQVTAPYVYHPYYAPANCTWIFPQAEYEYPSVPTPMELQDYNLLSSKCCSSNPVPEKAIIKPSYESKSDSQDFLFGCNLRLHHDRGAATLGNISDLSSLKTILRQPQFSENQTNINPIPGLNNFSLSINPISEEGPAAEVSNIDSGFYSVNLANRNAILCSILEDAPRKPLETIGQARTSQYRGVTRHRWTKRYEAHLWDNTHRIEGKSRKGKQVYLGGYDKEDDAARAYDLAALKYWGPNTPVNFPLSNYSKQLEEMKSLSRHEFVASLRRKSSGFSRGASIYRGVTRHHQHGRWQARIGRVAGHKDLYLGTFGTQEEAAQAYDRAAIKYRGIRAITNFEMSRYVDVLKEVSSSNDPTTTEDDSTKIDQVSHQGNTVRSSYTLKSTGEDSQGIPPEQRYETQYGMSEFSSFDWH